MIGESAHCCCCSGRFSEYIRFYTPRWAPGREDLCFCERYIWVNERREYAKQRRRLFVAFVSFLYQVRAQWLQLFIIPVFIASASMFPSPCLFVWTSPWPSSIPNHKFWHAADQHCLCERHCMYAAASQDRPLRTGWQPSLRTMDTKMRNLKSHG